MKILKHGKEKQKKPTLLFTCSKCGCEFEVESTEYTEADVYAQMHDNIEAECKCPECGYTAYRYLINGVSCTFEEAANYGTLRLGLKEFEVYLGNVETAVIRDSQFKPIAQKQKFTLIEK